MPLLDLIAKHLVHQPMLLDSSKAPELLRNNVQLVHRAAAARDVLDLLLMSAFYMPRT